MSMASNKDRLTRSPQSIRHGNADPYHDGSEVQIDMNEPVQRNDEVNSGAREVESGKIVNSPGGYPIRR
jgi:hypothetical protein